MTKRNTIPRPFPSVVRVAAFCVNPRYRKDWGALYRKGDKDKRKSFFGKYYQPMPSSPLAPAHCQTHGGSVWRDAAGDSMRRKGRGISTSLRGLTREWRTPTRRARLSAPRPTP